MTTDPVRAALEKWVYMFLPVAVPSTEGYDLIAKSLAALNLRGTPRTTEEATATPPLVYILCPDGEPPDIRGVYASQDALHLARAKQDLHTANVGIYSVQGAATAPAPTAIANRILDAVEEQGLAAWTLLSDDDSATCRAELAAAITAILKDGTP